MRPWNGRVGEWMCGRADGAGLLAGSIHPYAAKEV